MAERRFFTDIILGADNMQIAFGTGNPESSITADVGSLYLRSNATDAGDSFWVKNSGAGDTGWVQVATISQGASAGDIMFIGSDGNITHDGTSSFTWDFTNNRLGINESSPDAALHVYDTGSLTSRMIFETDSTANFPGIQLQWDGSGTRRVLMRGGAVSSLNTTGGTDATELQIYTRDSGGTLSQNFIFDQDGHLNINSGNQLRLWNSTGWTGGDYISISASGATGTQAYILPDAVGSSGQYLELDNAGTGQLIWSTPAGGGGGATTLDELTDVDVDPAQDGDLLQYIGGSVDEWHPVNNIDLSMISHPNGARSNIFPIVIVDESGRLTTTYKSGDSVDSYIYLADPDSSSGGSIALGSGQNGAVLTLTGTNLSSNSFFQELAGGVILWQSFGLSGDLNNPVAIEDTPGIIDIYTDSDGEGQAQSYGYFQCSGYTGSAYTNSCVLGAFYDKDGPSLSEATGGLPGKWIFCTSNGINESFPQPALSVFSDKTVEVVRGTFRIRLGNEMQLWNTDNDSYVSLRAPASPSNGSDNEVNLILPDSTGNDGEVLTTDGTGEMFWGPAVGAVQFEISQAVTLDLLDGVYYDGNDWQPAQANAAETLGTHVVTSASHPFYTLTQAGRITVSGHGLNIGEYYFSDWKTAGTLTATEPPQFSNPLVFVETEDIIHILPFRPSQVNEVSAPFIKGVGIESPTSSEDITMFFTDDAITITQMNAVLRGSSTPSVTWTIRHDTDRSATGNEVVTSGTATTSTTTGSEVTSFNDETIPAGSWVWLETTAQSGTVDEINVTIEYTID